MSVAVRQAEFYIKVGYFAWLLTNTNVYRSCRIHVATELSLVPRPVSALGVLHHLPGSGGLPIARRFAYSKGGGGGGGGESTLGSIHSD